MYITSQVLAGFAMFFNIFSRFFKKQSHSLFYNFISNIFSLLSCIFLYAFMGMVGLVVSIIRTIVFYIYSKNDWEKKLWLLWLFFGLQLGVCILTSAITGFIWWDFALIFVKSALYSYGAWQRNVHVFRWFCILSCLLTVVYFLIHIGYINALAEVVSIVILLFMEIRDKFFKKSKSQPIGQSKDMGNEEVSTNETL